MVIYHIFIIEKALLNAKNQLESIRWSNSLLFYHISLYQIVFNLYTIIVHLINAYQRQYQLFNISPPIHKKSHISLSFFPIPILSRFFPHRTYRMNPVQSILWFHSQTHSYWRFTIIFSNHLLIHNHDYLTKIKILYFIQNNPFSSLSLQIFSLEYILNHQPRWKISPMV